MNKRAITISVAVILYLLLRHAIPYGGMILYPIRLFVTYLHELGHSTFAVITGGKVTGIQINTNGSGYALISGGWQPLMLAGGYLGSALFGNIILYIAVVKEQWNRHMTGVFMVTMLLTGIFLYQSVTTSIILFVFASGLYVLIRFFEQALPSLNAFIGCVSICYILEDFWQGPASDLAKFTQSIPILPPYLWAIIWLAIAAYMTYYNIRYFILNAR